MILMFPSWSILLPVATASGRGHCRQPDYLTLHKEVRESSYAD
jgi:hypothetical protein